MEYVVICLVSIVVAGLTFFSGFGLGTLLMPVFAVFFPVEVAISATAAVHLANNAFKVFLVGRHAMAKVVLLFAVPAAAAAVPGALLLNYFAEFPPLASYTLAGKAFFITPVKTVIAVVIAVFSFVELVPALKRLTFDLRLMPLGGVLSGFFGGLSGHQGALRSSFLLRANLDKKALLGTMVLSAVIVDISRLAVYGTTFLRGDFAVLREQGVSGLVAAGTLSALIGSLAGFRLFKKMTLRTLRAFVAAMLFVLAAALGFGIV